MVSENTSICMHLQCTYVLTIQCFLRKFSSLFDRKRLIDNFLPLSYSAIIFSALRNYGMNSRARYTMICGKLRLITCTFSLFLITILNQSITLRYRIWFIFSLGYCPRERRKQTLVKYSRGKINKSKVSTVLQAL